MSKAILVLPCKPECGNFPLYPDHSWRPTASDAVVCTGQGKTCWGQQEFSKQYSSSSKSFAWGNYIFLIGPCPILARMLCSFYHPTSVTTLFQEKYTTLSENVCICSINSERAIRSLSLPILRCWLPSLTLCVTKFVGWSLILSFTVPFIQAVRDPPGQVPNNL